MNREFTVLKPIESYGSYYVDYDYNEAKRPVRMTEKQALFIARRCGGFVVSYPLPAIA